VAFVATVYGVGLANIVLLPAANKMKARVRQETQRKELVVEGVAGIVEGLNPKLIRCKLEAYYLQDVIAAPATPEAAPAGEDREVGARAQKPRAAAVRSAV
jgi:chemotaxis protein MotA